VGVVCDRHGDKVSESRWLLSLYPLSTELRERLEHLIGSSFTGTCSATEFKRLTPLGLLRALREIRAEELWLAVSDHDYQPLLPLLLVVAGLTRARRLVVTDFEGRRYRRSPLSVRTVEPLRILWGSVRGLAAVGAARREVSALLRRERVPIARPPRRPRLAYLKTNLWFGVQAGGSVGHIAGVVNGLVRLGCPTTVYAVEALPMLDERVGVVRVPCRQVTGLPLDTGHQAFQRVFLPEVLAALERDRPDVIYQRNCLANFAGVALSRRLGLPFVLEYNGSEVWAAEKWGTPPRFRELALDIERANLRHAHRIVVVSAVLREELLGRGVEPERVVLYPNCIDPLVFDPGRFSVADQRELRARWGIPPEALVCTFLGTFGPWHGVTVFAECIRHLASAEEARIRAAGLRFLFVGDGQLLPRVREILRAIPSDLYHLVGLVPQREGPRYLAASDILVSPHVPNPDGTRFFGSPTKLFEYMAMERAILASDLEQIGEVLEGSHHVGRDGMPPSSSSLERSRGFLITPGSAEELAQAILYLAGAPDARRMLGAAARKEALARYTWSRHVEAIRDSLATLPAPPHPPARAGENQLAAVARP